MKKELQNKEQGLGFLRHWKVMTMTLLLLTFSIGNVWGVNDTITLTGLTAHNSDKAVSEYFAASSTLSVGTNEELTSLTSGVDITSGYVWNTNGSNNTTLNTVSYACGQIYQNKSGKKWSEANPVFYAQFVIPTGATFTLSKINYAFGTKSAAFTTVIEIYNQTTSSAVYTSSAIDISSGGTAVSNITGLTNVLNSGTYRIKVSPATTSTSTGKYWGMGKLEVIGEYTAASSTNHTVTIDPNGGSYAETPTGWTYDDVADKYTKSIASGTSFSAPAGLTNGTDDLSWKDGDDHDITFPVSITGDITFVAQWTPACTPPGTPGTPSVSSKTHNSANLTWTAAANSNGYKISVVKKSGSIVIVDWTDCATNSYSASGLDPETTYTFKVKAKGVSGYCELGDEANADFTTNPDPCSAWGLGTSYSTTPGGGSSTTAGDLTITNIGGVSNSSTTVYSGSGSVKTFTPNSGSKYLTGSLGGTVIESVTLCISTSSADAGQNTADIVFSSAATFDTEKLLNYTGQTYKVHSFVVGKTTDDKGTYTFTAPAGAKSFAVGRNFGFTSDRGGADRASSLGGNRNVYYIQACPHVCAGSEATAYAVSGTTSICPGANTNVTLANSQTGAKYVLLKNDTEVASSDKIGDGSPLVWSVSEIGTYTVKVVEYGAYCEKAMTGSAVITAATAPVITTQPTASQKVAVSSAISLSVESSTDGVSYQWYSMTDPAGPAVIIDGKDEATLEITSAPTATTVYYYCLISKSGMCSVESDLATVITKTGCETETLATSTDINDSSDAHTGCTTTINLSGQKLGDGKYYEMSLNGGFKAGDIVTVNVKANDYESGKLYMVYGTHSSYSGYQVQNGPTEGNTADVEFVIPSNMATIGILRTTTTSDGDKTQNHEIKSVTVERETCYCVKPTIGTQPASSAICSGLTVTLTVGNITGGVAPYTYAWYNGDGTAVSGGSGAATASYTTAALVANASYYCVVSTADGCSAQSNTAAITIKPATTITTQPVDADASIGIAREFSVVATGAGTLTYQWQIQEGENWSDIANADEATYSVSKNAAGDYKFRCIVSGDCGDDVTSNVVTLSVSADVLTVTYNANGGTCETSSATWTEGDDALVLPTATKANFDFIGWYDAATGGNKIASPYTPSASIELFAHYMPKLVQAIYSNTFDAFIKNQAVNVYYLQGESAPTLSSIKVLGEATPVFEEVGGNIKVTIDAIDYIFPVTKTAVAPYTGTGSKETFTGSDEEKAYIKTGNEFSTASGKEGWKFSKTDNDWSRETDGRTRLYFFLGAAEEIAFENGGTARNIKVYRNGTLLDEPTSSGSATITGTNTPAMYAIVSNQTDGDGALKSMTFTPWVPVSAITLKEGTTAITSKEIAQGAQFTLTAEVTPANASNPAIVWESANALIASVDGGVVTGEATGGPVNIIARSQDDNSIYAACAVTVAAPCTPATVAWDVEPADGIKGHNGSASVTTNYAAGLEVVSSDPTVASVSNDGVNITINYLKKGTTKITATVVGDGSTYCNTPASVEKTITVSPDCPVSGNLFAWAYDPEATGVAYEISKNIDDVEVVTTPGIVTVSGGQAYFGSTSSGSTTTVTNGVCLFRNNSKDYAKIILECPLQVGDKISYTATNNREHKFYKDAISGDPVSSVSKQVMIDSDTHPLYNAEVLYVQGSNSDSEFKTFSIDRLAPVTGVSLADATVAIGNTVTPTMTLLPSNEAYYESIAWSIIGEGEGTIANISATTGAVTALAAGTVTVQVKLNNSESLKATCTVEVVASFDQVDVTEATVWDITNVSASAIELPEEKRNGLLLANVNGVNNNASFNSQALYFEGQHIGRISSGVKHLAGRKVQFNVTVPGAVLVTFASNGSNQRTVAINGKKCARTTNDGTYITYALAVEPGSVEIVGYQGTSANQYVRISKIEFKTAVAYPRTVNPNNIGTLCWTNNAILGGATLYELKGKNENNYLVFDEVEENRLEAGKPYIFVPENGNTQIKVYNTDDEAALTSPVQNESGMQGTFDDLSTLPEPTGQGESSPLWNKYIISNNHYVYVDYTNCRLGAYRAYVIGLDNLNVVSNDPEPVNGTPRRRLAIGGKAPQNPTGLDELNAGDAPVKVMINGELFILRGEKMYDATGRLVK